MQALTRVAFLSTHATDKRPGCSAVFNVNLILLFPCSWLLSSTSKFSFHCKFNSQLDCIQVEGSATSAAPFLLLLPPTFLFLVRSPDTNPIHLPMLACLSHTSNYSCTD